MTPIQYFIDFFQFNLLVFVILFKFDPKVVALKIHSLPNVYN